MVHSTHGHTDTNSIHTLIRDHRYTSHTLTHTHTPKDTRPRNTPRDCAIAHSTQTQRHRYTLSHVRRSWPAGRQNKVAEWTQGVSRETPVSSAPPESNRSGRRPAAESQALPVPGRRSPARARPPPGSRVPPRPCAPRSARRPSPPRGPSRPPPDPGSPRHPPGAPQPGRRLGSAACQRRAELAKQQTARHVGGGGRGAPITPSRAFCPARPGRDPDAASTTCSGPARHTRTHAGHTHTFCHQPLARPRAPRTRPRRRSAPHSPHSWTRSQHARAHSHPLQTRSSTRSLGTLGIHSDPRSPRRRTPLTPDTPSRTHRAHSAPTHVPGPFPRLHTRTRISQAHTPHTRSLIHTRAKIHCTLSATRITHTHTHTVSDTQQTALPATACKMQTNATHSRYNSGHTSKLGCTHNAHTSYLAAQTLHTGGHTDPQLTPNASMHTTFPPTYSWTHNIHSTFTCTHTTHGHTTFADTEHPEHRIAHSTLRHTQGVGS